MAPELSTYTYAQTRTRTEAILDQFDMFLMYAGIHESARKKILVGVENRWIWAAAAYVENARGRILEAEVRIDWTAHSDHAVLTPTVRTDLPGWESGAAPEIRTIGRRFGSRAQELGMSPRYWVAFTAAIHANRAEYLRVCPLVGVAADSKVSDWASQPRSRSYGLLDLPEVSVDLKEAT